MAKEELSNNKNPLKDLSAASAEDAKQGEVYDIRPVEENVGDSGNVSGSPSKPEKK